MMARFKSKLLKELFCRSLTRDILLSMALRILAVTIVSAGISYFHLMSTLESQTREQLQKYVLERGKREESLFTLAEDNHKILKQALLKRLEQLGNQDPREGFNQLFYLWSDGTWRNFLENQPVKQFDSEQYPSVFIGKQVPNTADIRRRMLVFYELTKSYGPAWKNRFVDTYIMGPENFVANYWPTVPWGIEAQADLFMPKEEYFYVSDKKHNPARETVWTGLYFDTVPKLWMVSVETPVDDRLGNHIATIGHDIILNELMERTVNDHLHGTYNLIFRSDGRLIVHPDYMPQIQKKLGQFNILESGDANLLRVYHAVKTSRSQTLVIDNSKDNEYLAVTRLNGPDWYFVTVYPKSLLSEIAANNARFVLNVGLIALLLEILLLFSVLYKQVTIPLNKLLIATDRVSDGNFDIDLNTKLPNELGHLATSFTSMANQLHESFLLLEKNNEELEVRVQHRTAELSQVLKDLQQTQSQLIQTEKMSSLGQLVAGIAHEINNPVNFIYGNLTHVNSYTLDLLQLINLYQQQYPCSTTTIQTAVEEIDLEFLKQDFPKLLSSMKVGTERIQRIVQSLRNFSRLDEAEFKAVDLHEGIESTLLILQNRLKAQPNFSEIEVIKNYGQLPLVECYPGQLNQVFMNLLSNAIDALEASAFNQQLFIDRNLQQKINPTICIVTQVLADNAISIHISDNGSGMDETVQAKLFDPFFTTKPVGKGTGLGLSISYQIVVGNHRGKLYCHSTLKQGTEFVIEIPIHQVGHNHCLT
ncbi:ATP-binding protein [Scytonema sp. UIC 10036]|uniref:ATP-binding protein n=1 Tax=Scytonema sp. UIC 10036 TaxID=2304196 RepID=UPI001FAAD1C7|nr:ATP-binding protein [Scytonema sp. UIC 10036]